MAPNLNAGEKCIFAVFRFQYVPREIFAGGRPMTFLEAFTKYGPDVERIADALGITPPEADRLINDLMDRRYQKRAQYSRRPA